MATYRALSTQERMGIADWSGSLYRGETYDDLPDYVASALLEAGIIEEATDEQEAT